MPPSTESVSNLPPQLLNSSWSSSGALARFRYFGEQFHLRLRGLPLLRVLETRNPNSPLPSLPPSRRSRDAVNARLTRGWEWFSEFSLFKFRSFFVCLLFLLLLSLFGVPDIECEVDGGNYYLFGGAFGWGRLPCRETDLGSIGRCWDHFTASVLLFWVNWALFGGFCLMLNEERRGF